MSARIAKKAANWGGKRPGAGRKPGATKVKISVSVDSETWDYAVSRWPGKRSQLVERLLREYVMNEKLDALK